jgi:sigma-B regulation protein RsbU (phosphoserine phosphatase)
LAIPNIQRFLVPRRPSKKFGSLEVAHLWRPLHDIGGDFLYYELVDEDHLSVEIGDVIGHDIHSGLVMTALHGLLFGLRQRLAPLNEILDHANRFLCRLKELEESRGSDGTVHPLLTSMFLLRVDYRRKTLTYCNAGHPHPLFLPKGNGKILHLKTGGPILGQNPEARYDEVVLRPAAGDTVLMFTDGLSEAANDQEQEFGTERLEQLLRETHESPPRTLVEQIDQRVSGFCASTPISDDVAMAVLQFGPNW